MFNLVSALSLASLAALSFGCATTANDNRRLYDDLQRAQVRALESQLRLAELERRFRELEQSQSSPVGPALIAQLVALGEKVEYLISQNQRLLSQGEPAEVPPTPASEPAETLPRAPLPPPASGDSADPREQLRYWAARVRADSSRWRGGLSPAQNEALNVLLRRERALDPANPWRRP